MVNCMLPAEKVQHGRTGPFVGYVDELRLGHLREELTRKVRGSAGTGRP